MLELTLAVVLMLSTALIPEGLSEYEIVYGSKRIAMTKDADGFWMATGEDRYVMGYFRYSGKAFLTKWNDREDEFNMAAYIDFPKPDEKEQKSQSEEPKPVMLDWKAIEEIPTIQDALGLNIAVKREADIIRLSQKQWKLPSVITIKWKNLKTNVPNQTTGVNAQERATQPRRCAAC